MGHGAQNIHKAHQQGATMFRECPGVRQKRSKSTLEHGKDIHEGPQRWAATLRERPNVGKGRSQSALARDCDNHRAKTKPWVALPSLLSVDVHTTVAMAPVCYGRVQRNTGVGPRMATTSGGPTSRQKLAALGCMHRRWCAGKEMQPIVVAILFTFGRRKQTRTTMSHTNMHVCVCVWWLKTPQNCATPQAM